MLGTADAVAVVESEFAKLGLDARLVERLTTLGYEEPTPIQREAIPPLLAGRDLIGRAATGTGKTAAFALPLLHRLASAPSRTKPTALILVPTRELAMQVAESVQRYGAPLSARVLAVYGGQPMDPQLRALHRGVDVVVATPGRALDHMRRGTIVLDAISVVVLDEADEMLDMGFAEDIEAILAATPKERQTMLFSATMPPRIKLIAGQHLTKPAEITVTREPVAAGELPRVRQTAYLVPRSHKLAALGRVLDAEAPKAALIFCKTRSEVDELTEALAARGYRPEALHGGMAQEQRDRVMRLFRSGRADLLVATDVAARGLDVEHLTHVVNYQLPLGTEPYVHRIGRVGRAGRDGVAITVAEPREQGALRAIERATGQRFEYARVPTAADVQARRMERSAVEIRETIAAGGLEQFLGALASLGGLNPTEVALAALKIAHTAKFGDAQDTADIPVAAPEQNRGNGPMRNAGPSRGSNTRGPAPGLACIFISAGRQDGIAPRDLVGAIANESGLPGRDIRGIEITDRFSLVEVPEEAADHVIESLNGARLRGRRVTARRDRRHEGALAVRRDAMTEVEWLACGDPEPMLKVVKGQVSDRKLRLFAIACCRCVWHLIEGESDRNAVEVAERVADELASNKERRAALHMSGAVASSTLYADVGIMVGFVRQRIAEELARPSETHTAEHYVWDANYDLQNPAQSDLVRDIFGNPFRPITADPAWLTDTAMSLARGMYDSRDFSAMPILADALQDAGCDNPDILNHCRDASVTHVRGCWVVDLVLGKS